MPANKNDLKWNAIVRPFPAIADPYAYESILLEAGGGAIGAAGDYTIDIGPVPAGKIWVITSIVQYLAGATATYAFHGVNLGASNWEINMIRPCPDPGVLTTTTMTIADAGKKIRGFFKTVTGASYARLIITGWVVSLY